MVGMQVDPEAMAKVEALPLLEVELHLQVPELVWVPDLLLEAPGPTATGEPRPLSGPQSVRAMWATWVTALLHLNGRVPRLDGSDGAGLSVGAPNPLVGLSWRCMSP